MSYRLVYSPFLASSSVMWLLNTKTGILRHFYHPQDVPGGYAILSHAWGPAEDTFQCVKEAEKKCEMNSTCNTNSSSETSTWNGRNLVEGVIQMQETIRKLESTVSTLSSRLDQLKLGSQPRNVVAGHRDIQDPPNRVNNSSHSDMGTTSTSVCRPIIPRDLLSEKTRRFLVQAEQAGSHRALQVASSRADESCRDYKAT